MLLNREQVATSGDIFGVTAGVEGSAPGTQQVEVTINYSVLHKTSSTEIIMQLQCQYAEAKNPAIN